MRISTKILLHWSPRRKGTMGKIIHLRARESDVSESSALHKGIVQWLESKPYNTRQQYHRIAGEWIRFLGYEPEQKSAQRGWVSAKHVDCQRFVNEVKKRPAQVGRSQESSTDGCVSMNTVRHKVSVLKAIYDELIAQGFVDANPFLRVMIELKKHQGGSRRPHDRLPNEAVLMLIGFQPENDEDFRDLCIFHLLFGAALRRSEVCGLKVGDVLKSERGSTYLRLRMTKSQKSQTVTLPDWAAETVNKLVDFRLDVGASLDDPLIALTRKNGRTTGMSTETIYRVWKRYLRKFDIDPRFSPHCARVTAITKMLDDGMTHRDVQELSRHASVQMVERYDRKRTDIDDSASKKLRY